MLYGVFLCSCRSRDPCPPLYSPGEAGVLVGYKVEILVGLHVENPIWTRFSSLFSVRNPMGPASTSPRAFHD